MPITRPGADEYASYYHQYISKVQGNDLLAALHANKALVNEFIKAIPGDKTHYRYAAGKWSVNEVLLHIIDCERVFAYRALSFGRNDKTPLPGFEENEWAPESGAESRNLNSILAEYNAVREATVALYESFTSEVAERTGSANNNPISVRALGYCICGHELHHIEVIRERYL